MGWNVTRRLFSLFDRWRSEKKFVLFCTVPNYRNAFQLQDEELDWCDTVSCSKGDTHQVQPGFFFFNGICDLHSDKSEEIMPTHKNKVNTTKDCVFLIWAGSLVLPTQPSVETSNCIIKISPFFIIIITKIQLTSMLHRFDGIVE